MKKKLLSFVAFICLAIPGATTEIQVVVSGKYFGTIDVVRFNSAYYLSVSEAGKIFGVQTQWSAVTQRVQLSLRGKQARFFVDSDEVSLGSEKITMPHPVIVRTSKVFIPLDFFLSKIFSEFSGLDCQFNPKTGLLTVDKRITVGPLRWVSYGDYTRVILNLTKGLTYSVIKQGRSGVVVSISFGKIESSEDISVEDGILKALIFKQGAQSAQLHVKLDGSGRVWRKGEYDNPRRLVIDVYKNAEVMRMNPAPPLKSVSKEVPVSVVSTATISLATTSVAGGDGSPSGARIARKYRIVIDAGHGGKDAGATGYHGTLEKDIALAAAKELATMLREEVAFEILLTREDDTFIPLDERSRRANAFGADLFVSLHCNAASRRSENGFEVYSLSEHASDPESQRVAEFENAVLQLEDKISQDEDLAKAAPVLRSLAREEFLNYGHLLAGFIHQNFSKRKVDLVNRGVKEAAFYVLRGTDSPAVLVEMGFLTNPKDEAKLGSRRYRRRLMEGISAGVLSYAKHQDWDLTGRP